MNNLKKLRQLHEKYKEKVDHSPIIAEALEVILDELSSHEVWLDSLSKEVYNIND